MTKYVLANWKAYKTMSEVEAWLEKFYQLYSPNPQVEVIIAPPAIQPAEKRWPDVEVMIMVSQ